MERRRGTELETALLDAAWEQLGDTGYGGFTFDAVAERAGTSKSVLYRRWPTRDALLMATLQRRHQARKRVAPDTGSLRGDVIALLRSANHLGNTMAAIVSMRMGTYFQETGKTPAIVRREILGDQPTAMETIFDRAMKRGEISTRTFPSRVVTLPFDLLRHEAMMTLSEVPDEVILEIVDAIFMPLVGIPPT
jgi:AcrR family transcriptional regulator